MWEITVGETKETFIVSTLRAHGYEVRLTMFQLIEVNTILFISMMAFAKISLCLFYRRLSDARWFQMANWTTLAVIVAYTVAIILVLVFACNPIDKSWDITIKSGQCIDKGALYVATAAINAATDLMLLLLPLPIIRQLKLPVLQKVGVMLMFVIGSM